MADCTAPTLSVPTLGCYDDPKTWATALVAEIQTAIDHVVGCVTDFEYPQCDICVMMEDLVDCPLTANMIDFSAVTWDEDGEQGVMPYPDSLSDYAFRTGTGATATGITQGGFTTVAIVFSSSFANTCEHVGITPTSVFAEDPSACGGGLDVTKLFETFVITKTKDGFTALFQSDHSGCSCKINFTYFAIGT